ncbi:uncharacterized protein LOC122943124 isoform X1 [Bufo gargarizans]|uniref:uncharacterized protein LOC122943124 isoform X1 n=1 Tax=Bufo gargarizans TaxID=30331 RepID=UPI001CF399A2|nr:uncharacterized protein LOC122943124 isoform X1 [Bufo gargarizans]
MDIWEHLDNKYKRIEAFSFNLEGEASIQITRSMDDVFKALERILQRQLRNKWEIRSLTQYLDRGFIPKGLTLTKTPASDLMNDEFRKEWDGFLKIQSGALIQMIIKRRIKMTEEMTGQIDTLKKEIEMFPNTEVVQKWHERICKNLDALEREIIGKKSKKLHNMEKKETTEIYGREVEHTNTQGQMENVKTSNRYEALATPHFLDFTPPHHKARIRNTRTPTPTRQETQKHNYITQSYAHDYNLRDRPREHTQNRGYYQTHRQEHRHYQDTTHQYTSGVNRSQKHNHNEEYVEDDMHKRRKHKK